MHKVKLFRILSEKRRDFVEMKKKISKILKIISTVLVSLVAALAILLVGVRLFGLQVYVVLSPSMEPVYQTGSIIYVRNVDTAKLEKGDVITFKLSESITATHRIEEVIVDEDTGARSFWTKGDANKERDKAPVSQDRVIGSPLFSIPYLGYLANYIQTPPGIYVAISAAAVLLLIVILSDFLDGTPKKKGKREKPALEENPTEEIPQ